MVNNLPLSKTLKTKIKKVKISPLSKDELLEELLHKKIGLNEYCLQILNHNSFVTSSNKRTIFTKELSVGELGFSGSVTTEKVYARAQSIGLTLCPPETAPYFRLQYRDPEEAIDPPKGNWRTFAMEKLIEDEDFPNGLYLRRMNDGFWLRGYRASADHRWELHDRFIFCTQENSGSISLSQDL